MPPEPAITPDKEPEEPSIEARPDTPNNHAPSMAAEPVEVSTRPLCERPPSNAAKAHFDFDLFIREQ